MPSEGKKKYSIELRLRVTDFECPPEEITSILGVKPSKVSIQGQPFSENSEAVSKRSAWRLDSSDSGANSSVEQEARALMRQLKGTAEKFSKLPANAKVQLTCVVYAYDYMPPLEFDTETLSFLVSIGAYLDFDIYDLIEDLHGGNGNP